MSRLASIFERRTLEGNVTLHNLEAGDFLSKCAPHTYELVFLDADRSRYLKWAPLLLEVTDFGVLVVDNAVSHAEELNVFRQFIRTHPDLDAVAIPIGKGQLVVRRKTVA